MQVLVKMKIPREVRWKGRVKLANGGHFVKKGGEKALEKHYNEKHFWPNNPPKIWSETHHVNCER